MVLSEQNPRRENDCTGETDINKLRGGGEGGRDYRTPAVDKCKID